MYRFGVRPLLLSSAVKPLGLTAEERASLVAFLEALTGEVAPDVTSPPRLPALRRRRVD
jgi:hypothetical protein